MIVSGAPPKKCEQLLRNCLKMEDLKISWECLLGVGDNFCSAVPPSLLRCAVKVQAARPRSLAQGQDRHLKVGDRVRLTMVPCVFMMYVALGQHGSCVSF